MFSVEGGSDKFCSESFTNVRALKTKLENFLDRSPSGSTGDPDWIIAITQDPPPAVIGSLGGYFDIPTAFFAAHASGGAINSSRISLPVSDLHISVNAALGRS